MSGVRRGADGASALGKLTKSRRARKRGLLFLIAPGLGPNPVASNPLFDDARVEHFPEQLSAFEKLDVLLVQLVSGLVTFIRAGADRIAAATPLPRATAAGAQAGDFADSDNLACLLVTDLLGNRRTAFGFGPGPGPVELRTFSGDEFARGEKEAVTAWYDAGRAIIRKSWEQSDLAERLTDILRQAVEVSRMINDLQHTCDLRGRCRYVCG